MKIYIAGKIGDLAKEVYEENFSSAKAVLKEHGYTPISPLDLDHSGHDGSWQHHMIVDLQALCECDGVFMLANWMESPGARIERDFAFKAGKQIMYASDYIRDEKWVPCPGHPKYQISSFGRLKNSRNKLIKLPLNVFGYPIYCFTITNLKGGKRVNVNERIHRLVAMAFLIKSKGKTQINHKNGIKTDNRVENLEWCTASENQLHAFATGLKPNQVRGENHKLAKITDKLAKDIKNRLYSGESVANISRDTGIHTASIYQIKRGHNWKHI